MDVRISIVAAMLCTAPLVAGQITPEDEERFAQRTVELYEIRIELVLADFLAGTPILDAEVEALRTAGRAAAAAFVEENPPKFSPVGLEAKVGIEPFSELLASDVWKSACEESLSPENLELLRGRIAKRQQDLVDATAALVEAHLVRGLCLTKAQRPKLDACLPEIAEDVLDAGLIQEENFWYDPNANRTPLTDALRNDELRAALTPGQLEVVDALVDEDRGGLHDYGFEIEYFAQTHDMDEVSRRMLHACAHSLVERRHGRQQRMSGRGKLMPRTDLADSDFWNKALATALDLPEGTEVPSTPSRSVFPIVDRRTEFLFAILDRRAYFTRDQADGLRAAIRRFVEDEHEENRASFGEMKLPSIFGVLAEDSLIDARDTRHRSDPSVDEKALLAAIKSVCTQDQSDALGF